MIEDADLTRALLAAAEEVDAPSPHPRFGRPPPDRFAAVGERCGGEDRSKPHGDP